MQQACVEQTSKGKEKKMRHMIGIPVIGIPSVDL